MLLKVMYFFFYGQFLELTLIFYLCHGLFGCYIIQDYIQVYIGQCILHGNTGVTYTD